MHINIPAIKTLFKPEPLALKETMVCVEAVPLIERLTCIFELLMVACY